MQLMAVSYIKGGTKKKKSTSQDYLWETTCCGIFWEICCLCKKTYLLNMNIFLRLSYLS